MLFVIRSLRSPVGVVWDAHVPVTFLLWMLRRLDESRATPKCLVSWFYYFFARGLIYIWSIAWVFCKCYSNAISYAPFWTFASLRYRLNAFVSVNWPTHFFSNDNKRYIILQFWKHKLYWLTRYVSLYLRNISVSVHCGYWINFCFTISLPNSYTNLKF